MSHQITVLFGLIVFGVCMVMMWLEVAHYSRGNMTTWTLALAAGSGAGVAIADLIFMKEYYLLAVFILLVLGCFNSATRASKLTITKQELQTESEETPSAS